MKVKINVQEYASLAVFEFQHNRIKERKCEFFKVIRTLRVADSKQSKGQRRAHIS